MSQIKELQLRAEEVSSIKLSLWSNIPVWTWIVVAIAVLALIIHVKSEIGYGLILEAILSGIFWVFILFVILAIAFTRKEENLEYDRWLADSHELIENLPTETYEIVYIKIDPEMTDNSEGVFFLGIGAIHTKTNKATPVSIAYKINGEVFIKTFWSDTNMRLGEDERPYLTFQDLPEDLGHGIEAGWYNPVIHLPSNYQFTDIK